MHIAPLRTLGPVPVNRCHAFTVPLVYGDVVELKPRWAIVTHYFGGSFALLYADPLKIDGAFNFPNGLLIMWANLESCRVFCSNTMLYKMPQIA